MSCCFWQVLWKRWCLLESYCVWLEIKFESYLSLRKQKASSWTGGTRLTHESLKRFWLHVRLGGSLLYLKYLFSGRKMIRVMTKWWYSRMMILSNNQLEALFFNMEIYKISSPLINVSTGMTITLKQSPRHVQYIQCIVSSIALYMHIKYFNWPMKLIFWILPTPV